MDKILKERIGNRLPRRYWVYWDVHLIKKLKNKSKNKCRMNEKKINEYKLKNKSKNKFRNK